MSGQFRQWTHRHVTCYAWGMDTALAARYCNRDQIALWTTTHRQLLERQRWYALLTRQRDLGFPIDQDDLDAYLKTIDNVTPELVAQHETETRHETLAHLRAWNTLAGREKLHLGLTSADIGTWVDRKLITEARTLLDHRLEHLVNRLADHAEALRDTPTPGYTHNQPAQPTTIGRRYAGWAEQLTWLWTQRPGVLPYRPASGAVGTRSDLLAYLDPADGGNHHEMASAKLDLLEQLPHQLHAPAQTYPHALELPLYHHYLAVSRVVASIGVTHRLAAGRRHYAETAAEGQRGSSAMSHKNNPRYNEQLHSHAITLAGYITMATQAAGETWYEGDVTHSATRRVYLPGIHLALDALYNTLHHVLDIGQWYPGVNKLAVQGHPEMSSGRWVAALVRDGVGREDAYEATRRLDLNPPDDLPGWPHGDAGRQTDQVVRAVRATTQRWDQLAWRVPN